MVNRFSTHLVVAFLLLGTEAAYAQLPPATAQEKAAAAEIAAKKAWSEKVGGYRLCLTMNHIAERYHAELKATGKPAPVPVETPPCTDPGTYQPTSADTGHKPLEAAESHSPPGTAVTAPNTRATETESKRGQ